MKYVIPDHDPDYTPNPDVDWKILRVEFSDPISKLRVDGTPVSAFSWMIGDVARELGIEPEDWRSNITELPRSVGVAFRHEGDRERFIKASSVKIKAECLEWLECCSHHIIKGLEHGKLQLIEVMDSYFGVGPMDVLDAIAENDRRCAHPKGTPIEPRNEIVRRYLEEGALRRAGRKGNPPTQARPDSRPHDSQKDYGHDCDPS